MARAKRSEPVNLISWKQDQAPGEDAVGEGPAGALIVSLDSGPDNPYCSPPGQGLTRHEPLKISLTSALAPSEEEPEGIAQASITLGETSAEILADDVLTYAMMPALGDPEQPFASTFFSLDLEFTDGTYLSDLGATDTYGIPLTPIDQGFGNALYPLQWNQVRVEVGKWAEGKNVARTLARIAAVEGDEDVTVWLDQVTLSTKKPLPSEPVEIVETRRGSNAGSGFSRGNNFPAVAVPNGFHMATPVTNADRDWFYAWARDDVTPGQTSLVGLQLSHAPSPWMGDRNQLVFFPTWDERRETFSHDDEVGKPYKWSAKLSNEAEAEVTSTEHAAVLEFTSPADAAGLELRIGVLEGEYRVVLDPEDGSFSGWVDGGSGLSAGRSRMFFYGTADQPFIAAKVTTSVDADASAVVTEETAPESVTAEQMVFPPKDGVVPPVTIRVAASFISAAQAKNAYDQEVEGKTFEQVAEETKAKWAERLAVLELPKATDEQLVSAYSSLYRVNLYPSSQTENIGTAEEPEYAYASPEMPREGEATDNETNAQVVPGKLYVNHGFWDTYRTAWPLYALVYPELAGELLDGFVEQARTAGWMPRWSSPGYANLMTGTSSDVVIADLYQKGVELPDVDGSYMASLKNATASSPTNSVGRNDRYAVFRGFPGPELGEAVSWGIEGAINDAGLSAMARSLAEQTDDPKRKERLLAEAEYLEHRGAAYALAFDEDTGFFRSRDAEGNFRIATEDFEPREWGGDYTETNAWNFAFPAPHDGKGLAQLYGGEDELEEKLDTFFATPENADHPGSYGGVIHEMIEARDVRMGQFGMSNQPSHHIPFMYHYVGAPNKSSRVSREVVERMFVGSGLGQGYPGDEDNGEMSAWYLFALSGLYPLQAGSPRYVMVAPGTLEAIWHLPGGDLRISAAPVPGQDAPADEGLPDEAPFMEAKEVGSVTLDGEDYQRTWISHDDLKDGAEVDFELVESGSTWGTDLDQAPPSLSAGAPQPWVDLTDATDLGVVGVEHGVPATLVDDVMGGTVELRGDAQAIFGLHEGAPRMYTLTSTDNAEAAPQDWVVEASTDGDNWEVVDERSGETFEWSWQTRPFRLDWPEGAKLARITLKQDKPAELSQVEFLAL